MIKKMQEFVGSLSEKGMAAINNTDTLEFIYEQFIGDDSYDSVVMMHDDIKPRISIMKDTVEVYISVDRNLVERCLVVCGDAKYCFYNLRGLHEYNIDTDDNSYSSYEIPISMFKNPDESIKKYLDYIVASVMEDYNKFMESAHRVIAKADEYRETEKVKENYVVCQFNKEDMQCVVKKDDGKTFLLNVKEDMGCISIFNEFNGWHDIYTVRLDLFDNKKKLKEEAIFDAWDRCLDFLNEVIYA